MDVIKNQGVFRLFDRHTTLLLTDEKQLDRIIEGPDVPLFENEEQGASGERVRINVGNDTLRSKCQQAADRGCTRMEVSYDFFFGGTRRNLYPSDETTVKAFKTVHDMAKEYGMAFGASILSPLDVGGGWAKISDETGFSYQYQETEIAPDGTYSVDMVCQRQWYNNKGPITVTPHKVLVYAFNEERVADTNYFWVDENAILDISPTATVDIDEANARVTGAGYGWCPMRIHGKWPTPSANRALCVMVYRTPELDYFAPSAKGFMKQLLDQHNAAGISYQGFYSDEMHIQFDWDLGEHFGYTELCLRYLTPNLAKKYAELYGAKYQNFAKYLVYMSYHQHDFLPGEEGQEPAQHVFGPTPEDIYDTWLFRNRYFELLQRTVVDLANWSKDYAEQLWGAPIMTRAHATWQESPSCDTAWVPKSRGGFDLKDLIDPALANVTHESPMEQRVAAAHARAAKQKELGLTRYDYTPWYEWSSSIRENISACYDYFKWNEFLTGSGTDHAEGGHLDRTYYSQALAASFSELNPYELAYCARWGAPQKVCDLFDGVNAAYGAPGAGPAVGGMMNFVNGFCVRCTDVLALYPIKLNNVEERFGSWMVQYGYCNYITEEKLLENAAVNENGTLQVAGKQYRCLVALFEPFLDVKTFDLIERFLAAGGKVLWSGVPALADAAGGNAARRFADLFGLADVTDGCFGKTCKDAKVSFKGLLAGIADMTVPTDLLPDFVYPCEAAESGVAVASIGDKTVAVAKQYPHGGLALYAGFRIRDDQSRSLGKDVDTLFRTLCAMGAYRPGSLEVRSRETDSQYVLNTFPDGSVACAPHFRTVYEAWEGKFFRDKAFDDAVLADRTDIPDGAITLNESICGHVIRHTGKNFFAYRLDEADAPVALLVCGSDGLAVDGKKYTFADRAADFHFAPVPAKYLSEGVSRAIMAGSTTAGVTLTVPAAAAAAPTVAACTDRVFGATVPVDFTWDGKQITFTVTEELAGKQVMIYWQ